VRSKDSGEDPCKPQCREISVRNEMCFSCPSAFSLKGVIGATYLFRATYCREAHNPPLVAVLKAAEKANKISMDIYP